MKEINKHILKKAIHKMPSFKPGKAELWKGIEARLDKKSNLQPDFSKLPVFKAPVGLWEKVEQGLKKPSHSVFTSKYFIIRTAAAFAILISIGIFIKYQYTAKSLTESTSIEELNSNASSKMSFESIYNPALCKGNPQICNTPIFKSLDKQLNDLKGELNQMKPMIQKGDPQVMKYYYRLENERVEVEKKMVKIIIES
jgi:hypothetical protein